MVSRGFVRRSLLLGAGAAGLLSASGAEAYAGKKAPKLSKPPQPVVFDKLLADIHRRTFNYFWESANPSNGLSADNWPGPNFCSIAATGFALTAYCIGDDSGYITREEATGRVVTTLRTFWNTPQGPEERGMAGHKGFFYHFLDMYSAERFKNVELSSVDTALFLCGALTAAAYFDGDSAIEAEIRDLAMNIYDRVDWTFMMRDNGLVSMGWHPEKGLKGHDDRGLIDRNWSQYNEGMLVYLLGMGSRTHPLPAKSWQSWMATLDGNWGTHGGEPHLGFSPMFGHQYSHVWYDFRGIADAYMRGKGIDYFINSQRATVAQRTYAIKNPAGYRDYGPDIWGLTASRGPGNVKAMADGRMVEFHEYGARGPQTGDKESFDDGTLAPTAALGSIPFAPDICTQAAHAMVSRYGNDLYGWLGFYDAFNPTYGATGRMSATGMVHARAGWVAYEYLGIDQGPILAMLENYRSGLVWDRFNRSPLTGPLVKRAFLAAGFKPVAPTGAWLLT
jgi:hypothetical protein